MKKLNMPSLGAPPTGQRKKVGKGVSAGLSLFLATVLFVSGVFSLPIFASENDNMPEVADVLHPAQPPAQDSSDISPLAGEEELPVAVAETSGWQQPEPAQAAPESASESPPVSKAQPSEPDADSFPQTSLPGSDTQVPQPESSVPDSSVPAQNEQSGGISEIPAAAAPMAQPVAYQLNINYFYYDDGEEQSGSVAAQPYYGEYTPGESYAVASPAVLGYFPDTATISGQMPAGNTTMDVWYHNASKTRYTVRHRFENAAGDGYEARSLYPTQAQAGVTGASSKAQPYHATGFKALPYTQTAIAADGSTVVEIQYNRVINHLYYATNGGGYLDPIELKYEQSTAVAQSPIREGYIFSGWHTDAALAQPFTQPAITMGDANVTLYAKWEANIADFTVLYWAETKEGNGEYEYVYSWSGTGLAGRMSELTIADFPPATGFEAVRMENVEIAADGSALAGVYFERKTYSLDFRRGFNNDQYAWWASVEDEPYVSITAKYGTSIEDQWNSMPTDFYDYRWIAKREYWAEWIISMFTMPARNHTYFGVGNTSGHVFDSKYSFETFDQQNDAYDREFGTLRYATNPDLTFRFTHHGYDIYLTGHNSNQVPGFTYTKGDFHNFDYNPNNTYHDSFYYYKRKVNTVSFNTRGGSPAPDPITERFETDIASSAPQDPTRTGHKFLGWYNNQAGEGTSFSFSTMPSSSVLLYAKWGKLTYTVDFDLNAPGASGQPASQQVAFEERVSEPAVEPQRAGYVFEGWYAAPATTGSRYVFDKPVIAPRTLYAGWSSTASVEYTVKYIKTDSGAAYAAPKTATGAAGQAKTETAYIDSTQKYVPDAATKSLLLGNSVSRNVLAFHYQPYTTLAYRVEYRYANTGALIPADVMGVQNPLVVSNSELARVVVSYKPIAGYLPDRYQKAQMLMNETSEASIADNVIVFYYTANTGTPYKVEHYLENPAATTQENKYNAAPAETNTHNAALGSKVSAQPKTFAGNSYNAQASEATVSGTVVATGKLVLKLYYDVNRYTVLFDSQDGSAVEKLENIAAGSVLVGEKPPNPTRAAHTFGGWFTEKNTVTEWNFSADTVKHDITLYAKWTKNDAVGNYRVSYHANGGSGTQNDDKNYPAASSVTVQGPGGIQRAGYTFTGWNTAEDDSGRRYAQGDKFTIRRHTALYAQWKQNADSAPVPAESEQEPMVVTPSAPTFSVIAAPSSSVDSAGSQGNTSASSTPPVAGDAPNNNNGAPPQLSEDDTAPRISGVADLIDNILDGNVPLGGLAESGVWSLLNLIMGVLAFVISVVLSLIWLLGNIFRKKQDEANKASPRGERSPFLRLGIVSAGVVAALVFLAVENITLPLVLLNRWTPLMAMLLAVQLAMWGMFLLSYRKKRTPPQNRENMR